MTDIQTMLTAEDFGGVLTLLREVESKRALTTAELIVKGRCLELNSPPDPANLREARQAYEQALVEDPQYVPAILELAWFLYSVDSDVKTAREMFQRALNISRAEFSDATLGIARCLGELESDAAALNYLQSTHIVVDDERIAAEISSLATSGPKK